MVTVGGVASTVQLRVTSSPGFPSASVACTRKTVAPPARPAKLACPPAQAASVGSLSEHAKVAPGSEVQVKVTARPLVEPSAGPTRLVVGPVRSITQSKRAGVASGVPARLTARTSKVWAPSRSGPTVAGDVQAAKSPAPSSRHSSRVTGPSAPKTNVAMISRVARSGPDVIDACGSGLASKRAVTIRVAAVRSTRQSAVPEQASDHPPKVCVASGIATSWIGVVENVAVQPRPQSIPSGCEITVPPPALWIKSWAVPVPERLEAASPPGAAETCNDAPCTRPTAPGVKTTPTVQLAPPASVAGHGFDEIANLDGSETRIASGPLGDWPVFFSAKSVSWLREPIASAPKACEGGASSRAPGVSAVPVSDAVGAPPGEPVTVSVVALAPAAPEGAN